MNDAIYVLRLFFEDQKEAEGPLLLQPKTANRAAREHQESHGGNQQQL